MNYNNYSVILGIYNFAKLQKNHYHKIKDLKKIIKIKIEKVIFDNVQQY